MSDLDEVEKELEALEEAQGLPAFYRSKPLLERMAMLGIEKETIDLVRMCLVALGKGEALDMNELPQRLKNNLAAQADAELLGAELLADIVQMHRRREA